MTASRPTGNRSRTAFIAAFLAPAVLLYGGLVLIPLVQAFGFSLYRWRGVSTKKTFIGAKNFTDLLHDNVFWKAVQNNLTLLVVGGFAVLVVAVAVAHALQKESRAIRALRGIVLFPQMVSLVAVAILWTFLLNPQYGLLTSGLKAVGLGGWVHTWLGDAKTALPSVGFTYVWHAVGFSILLFAAGLKALPGEVAEAAELDGSNGLHRFWYVTWPMLWAVRRVAIVNLTIAGMNIFALVYLMTQGGPDRATEVMLTYLYESAFVNSQFGYATAIAAANFVIVMLLSAVILVATRRNPEVSR